MRLGVSSSLNTNSPEEWAGTHSALGCKSVVFPLDCKADRGLVDEYVQAARENNLMIAEVGIWRNAISQDDSERLENMKFSIGQLELADYIGARCCVNVAGAAGAPGCRWDGGYRENFSPEAWNKTVTMVQKVIDEVRPTKTYFALEPMPWMYPSSPEEYLRLIDDVGRDRFAVHMDIINMTFTPERFFFPEKFLENVFTKLGTRIRSCHIKDIRLLPGYTFQLEECACGQGVYPLEEYVRYIDVLDCEMPVIIEHLKNDEEYYASMKYVKGRLEDGK